MRRSGTRLLCALALLCVAARFQGVCCRGGGEAEVGGGGGEEAGIVGGGVEGVGGGFGRPFVGGAGAGAAAGAHNLSSVDSGAAPAPPSQLGAWRVASAGAALSAAGLLMI